MVRVQALKRPIAHEKKKRGVTILWGKGLVLPLVIIGIWQIVACVVFAGEEKAPPECKRDSLISIHGSAILFNIPAPVLFWFDPKHALVLQIRVYKKVSER